MKTTIFGAGAVGGHLAARLGAAGADIAAVCRGAQLAAIRERGITLHIRDERYHARIRATDRPEELGRQDLVIVTAKSSTLPETASAIATLCGPDTTVVFAMNGIPWWYLYRAEMKAPAPDLSRLDPAGALAREIGHERVVGCMINSANSLVAPGVLENAPMTRNKFTLGEPDGTLSQRLRAIAAFLEGYGLEIPLTETIRVEIWDKLLRNLATSPICALTGEPIGVIGRHPELYETSRALMREGLAVALAHGIAVEDNFQSSYGARPTSPHKSSMLQDFERNRPPEIDGILTSVQAFARAARVPTPTVDAVTALVIEKARRMGLYPQADW
ncbi:MAG TPA: 2-dehydropantoate 2-reductase [Stellaceae bacterium]|nr:2-dehydropantoate 2-reductase [Stellaceae bacterium]